MSRKIISVGYEIPGHSDDYVCFGSEQSLMEADILLISPDALEPNGHWVEFTVRDGGCYDIDASKKYKQKMSRLKKEIEDHLNAGKNVFAFLTKKEDHCLAYNVSIEKKTHNFSTEIYSNYNFLPVDIGVLTSASGKHIEFSGNQIFSDFYKAFKENLKYKLYIENPNNCQVVFTGKDKTKILGAVYKIGNGNLVVLPYVDYDYEKFIKIKKDSTGREQHCWTEPAMKFGKSFVDKLVKIDYSLHQEFRGTPPPEWSLQETYILKRESQLFDDLARQNKEIIKIGEKIKKLEVEISEEQILKGLLFEQGKPLEMAVMKALRILGYAAEGYNDGILELDHIIFSPEGQRYIGECEGKDNKDIDITKFRQLTESMSADFSRDDVEEKAFGILFGNPQRFMSPDKRTLDFTKKCKIGALREKIALIKTPDLFTVAKYALETDDEVFKKNCRTAIHNALGSVVVFPKKSKNEK